MKAESDHPREILRFVGVARIHKSEKQSICALGPVDFAVHEGEFVAVMGPSGSGKSTLLMLAGALDDPTHGQVIVAGRNLARASPSERAVFRRHVVGYVFQELNLLPGLTAIENVALPLEVDGMRWRDARALAEKELSLLGLAELRDRFPDDLSGGERQRVAIARALLGDRRILLADEPTGALDSITGEQVMGVLRQQCDRGRTVVLVTHNALHACWADRILHLRDGCIVDEACSPDRLAGMGGAAG